MSSKYKLLKDLPGYKAGTVFVLKDGFGRDNYWAEELEFTATTEVDDYLQKILWSRENDEQHTDWFEPIKKPTRWRAEIGKTYYLVNTTNHVEDMLENTSNLDKACYNLGNYFKTREQAETVAEAIKKMLEWIHSDDTTFVTYNKLERQLHIARKAVQGDSDAR